MSGGLKTTVFHEALQVISEPVDEGVGEETGGMPKHRRTSMSTGGMTTRTRPFRRFSARTRTPGGPKGNISGGEITRTVLMSLLCYVS